MSTTRRLVVRAVVVPLAVIGVIAVAASFRPEPRSEYLDGHQVEGVWVSDVGYPFTGCDQMSCDREALAVSIATDLLLERIPGAVITRVQLHGAPSERADGILADSPMRAIVFDLDDGTQRVETYSCSCCSSSRSEFNQVCEPNGSPHPDMELLRIQGTGPLERLVRVEAGKYKFRWWVTAGDTACRAALALEGPASTITLDQDEDVVAGESATGGRYRERLAAGTFAVKLATDCPGESSLEMWQYLD